ncbi:MAG: M1 family aminopeptidase [Bacteroidia bacterium]|nr:M1 family aminopeptidase [Bacteroidia bacterium]
MKKAPTVFLLWVSICFAFAQGEYIDCQSKKKAFLQLTSMLREQSSIYKLSDTLDVLQYTISLNFDSLGLPTVAAKTLRGNTVVKLKPKINGINKITLMLYKLTIDSIKVNNTIAPYTYDNTLIRISTAALSTNDTLNVQVFYKGKPQQDPKFGGFYFQNPYIYNIGVGFKANPHSFGRVWFPCIDEFTDRAYFEFFITTIPNHKAFCNGLLQGVTTNANGTKTWHWKLHQTIPAYLAAVAIADYATLHRTSHGIPVQFAARPSDTTAVKNMYVRLDSAVKYDIQRWGPHVWDKIGFICVPFLGGAMEHATSIHMSSYAIGTAYEFLYAHELAHHWFGDYVTCQTEGDMWLNEGWAAYNEAMFMEVAYDTTKYKDYVRTNHREVLQLTHTPLKDSGYYALSGVPHHLTYGSTVYEKGADVVHTLRYYMGDDKFFPAVKHYLATYGFGNANSTQLRDALSAHSGIDLTDFFNNWVFNPGFPHFSIDSTKIIDKGGGLYDAIVYVRQRLKGAPNLFNMKVPISACKGPSQHYTQTFVINQAKQSVTLTNIPFEPTWFAIDRWEKVSDAVSDFEATINTTGSFVMKETNVTLNTTNLGDGTARIRITHDWVAPEGKIAHNNIILSDYHYWTVSGHFPTNFVTHGTFRYDGTLTSTGYIDNTFIDGTEDSLVMMYRKDATQPWQMLKRATLLPGTNKFDKRGAIRVDTLIPGEYALGKKVEPISSYVNSINVFVDQMELYPNPASEVCTVRLPANISLQNAELECTNMQGKTVLKQSIHQHEFQILTKHLPKGLYLIKVQSSGNVCIGRLLVQ